MTLFMRARPADPLFAAVLQRFFDGTPDAATDERLANVGAQPSLLATRLSDRPRRPVGAPCLSLA